MANRAYIGLWTSSYSEDVMLDRFERLLETAPLSQKRPGFASLVIRAVDPAETPLLEMDLRGVGMTPADVIAVAAEHRNSDCSYEVAASWDVWQHDVATGLWQRDAAPILMICHGEAYDDGVAAEAGHFSIDLGFEQFVTGDSGLLGRREAPDSSQDPLERQFLALMESKELLSEYYGKIRENIKQLQAWVRAIENALPVERIRLWSEGEENLEARMDEILAAG